jgi:hypothetical protein
MKISVDIRITDKISSYESKDVALAKLEIEAPWDDVKPTAVHRALDDVLDDVVERVKSQLRAEGKHRLAMRDDVETLA